MSKPVLPAPWHAGDADDVASYLLGTVSALRLGVWSADRFRAELAATMLRLMQGDATVLDAMQATDTAIDRELSDRFGDYEPPEGAFAPPPIRWSGGAGEADTRDLATHTDAGGTVATTLRLGSDGALRVLRMDFGPATEAIGGDSEHWVDIPADYVPALAFALLSEQLRGKFDAVDRVDRFCVQHRIPCHESRR
ncbi:hypothetical protein BH10PSE15_BH10PSE15_03640 [soil metagenome]